MIKRFKVILMSVNHGIIEHIVNCNDMISAQYICEGIYDRMRVIDIMEI